MRMGIFGISVGREQNMLGKEQNSSFLFFEGRTQVY
jgi:hypothetical protein